MPKDLLLVDDDVGAIRLMDRVLEGVGRHRFATSGLEALELARSVRPDMVLLDADMPGLDGLAVLRAMRADPELRDIPVIMVTSHEDMEALSLECGAEDFILKPLDRGRLLSRVTIRLREHQQRYALQRLALLDPLTELANSRFFSSVLEREWARAAQACAPMALVLLTIDGPAELHLPPMIEQLQMCIRSAAWVLHDIVRQPADFIAHFGLGAFALLLPDTGRLGAEDLLTHIHAALDHLELDMGDGAAPWAVSAGSGIGCVRDAGGGHSTQHAGFMAAALHVMPIGADRLLHAAQTALHAAQAVGPGQTRLLDVHELERGLQAARLKIQSAVP